MSGKSFVKIILAIVLVLTLTMVGSGSALAADTIKLGVAGAHSGDLASY